MRKDFLTQAAMLAALAGAPAAMPAADAAREGTAARTANALDLTAAEEAQRAADLRRQAQGARDPAQKALLSSWADGMGGAAPAAVPAVEAAPEGSVKVDWRLAAGLLAAAGTLAALLLALRAGLKREAELRWRIVELTSEKETGEQEKKELLEEKRGLENALEEQKERNGKLSAQLIQAEQNLIAAQQAAVDNAATTQRTLQVTEDFKLEAQDRAAAAEEHVKVLGARIAELEKSGAPQAAVMIAQLTRSLQEAQGAAHEALGNAMTAKEALETARRERDAAHVQAESITQACKEIKAGADAALAAAKADGDARVGEVLRQLDEKRQEFGALRQLHETLIATRDRESQEDAQARAEAALRLREKEDELAKARHDAQLAQTSNDEKVRRQWDAFDAQVRGLESQVASLRAELAHKKQELVENDVQYVQWINQARTDQAAAEQRHAQETAALRQELLERLRAQVQDAAAREADLAGKWAAAEAAVRDLQNRLSLSEAQKEVVNAAYEALKVELGAAVGDLGKAKITIDRLTDALEAAAAVKVIKQAKGEVDGEVERIRSAAAAGSQEIQKSVEDSKGAIGLTAQEVAESAQRAASAISTQESLVRASAQEAIVQVRQALGSAVAELEKTVASVDAQLQVRLLQVAVDELAKLDLAHKADGLLETAMANAVRKVGGDKMVTDAFQSVLLKIMGDISKTAKNEGEAAARQVLEKATAQLEETLAKATAQVQAYRQALENRRNGVLEKLVQLGRQVEGVVAANEQDEAALEEMRRKLAIAKTISNQAQPSDETEIFILEEDIAKAEKAIEEISADMEAINHRRARDLETALAQTTSAATPFPQDPEAAPTSEDPGTRSYLAQDEPATAEPKVGTEKIPRPGGVAAEKRVTAVSVTTLLDGQAPGMTTTAWFRRGDATRAMAGLAENSVTPEHKKTLEDVRQILAEAGADPETKAAYEEMSEAVKALRAGETLALDNAHEWLYVSRDVKGNSTYAHGTHSIQNTIVGADGAILAADQADMERTFWVGGGAPTDIAVIPALTFLALRSIAARTPEGAGRAAGSNLPALLRQVAVAVWGTAAPKGMGEAISYSGRVTNDNPELSAAVAPPESALLEIPEGQKAWMVLRSALQSIPAGNRYQLKIGGPKTFVSRSPEGEWAVEAKRTNNAQKDVPAEAFRDGTAADNVAPWQECDVAARALLARAVAWATELKDDKFARVAHLLTNVASALSKAVREQPRAQNVQVDPEEVARETARFHAPISQRLPAVQANAPVAPAEVQPPYVRPLPPEEAEAKVRTDAVTEFWNSHKEAEARFKDVLRVVLPSIPQGMTVKLSTKAKMLAFRRENDPDVFFSYVELEPIGGKEEATVDMEPLIGGKPANAHKMAYVLLELARECGKKSQREKKGVQLQNNIDLVTQISGRSLTYIWCGIGAIIINGMMKKISPDSQDSHKDLLLTRAKLQDTMDQLQGKGTTEHKK